MLKRYSRLIVLYGMSFGCVAINLWLVMTGHYKLPFFVLVACIVGIPLIIRKLPPIARATQEIRNNQLKAASTARRMGWIFVAGLAFGTLSFVSGGAKELPWWLIVLLIGWSAFLIWGCFSLARKFKKNAGSQSETPQ